MLVKLKRTFITRDGRYDPRKRDTHEIPVALELLPSDALILDGDYKGLTAAEAREKKASTPVAPTPAVATATAALKAPPAAITPTKAPPVPQKGASLKDDEE